MIEKWHSTKFIQFQIELEIALFFQQEQLKYIALIKIHDAHMFLG